MIDELLLNACLWAVNCDHGDSILSSSACRRALLAHTDLSRTYSSPSISAWAHRLRQSREITDPRTTERPPDRVRGTKQRP